MMPHSMLHFTEDERDYIKLKKVQAFVQHFISWATEINCQNKMQALMKV